MDQVSSTQLLKAASAGDFHAVSRLLALGIKPDVADSEGATALILAARSLHKTSLSKTRSLNQTIAVLLRAGANVNKVDSSGASALSYSALYDQTGVSAKTLMAYHADYTISDRGFGNTALHWAFSQGNGAAVAAILPAVTRSDRRNKEGVSALMMAAGSAASINPSTLCRWMDRLLKTGAQINGQDSNGGTPLMWAVQASSDTEVTEVTRFLLSRGALPNLKDKSGGTALMYAAAEGHLAQCKLLIKSGANVDARDTSGATALMRAVSGEPIRSAGFNNPQIVSLLLANGADVRLRDNFGKTAADLARENAASPAIVDLLKDGKKARRP